MKLRIQTYEIIMGIGVPFAVLAFIESELGYWGPYWAFTMFAIVFVLGGQLMKPERKEE